DLRVLPDVGVLPVGPADPNAGPDTEGVMVGALVHVRVDRIPRQRTSSGAATGANTRATVGGAGGGAGLVGLAPVVGTQAIAGSIIRGVAPAASIGIGFGLVYLEAWARRLLDAQEVASALRKADQTRRRIEARLASEYISDGHRRELRAVLEQL